MKRIIISGGVGGALVPLMVVAAEAVLLGRSFAWVLPLLMQYSVAGACCAAGSLVLARRGHSDLGRTPSPNRVAPAT